MNLRTAGGYERDALGCDFPVHAFADNSHVSRLVACLMDVNVLNPADVGCPGFKTPIGSLCDAHRQSVRSLLRIIKNAIMVANFTIRHVPMNHMTMANWPCPRNDGLANALNGWMDFSEPKDRPCDTFIAIVIATALILL